MWRALRKEVPWPVQARRYDRQEHSLCERCGCFAGVFCAAWFVAGTRPAAAGINVWTRHGPPGGDVVALSIDPTTRTTLYAGTDRGGVLKSAGRGGAWPRASTPIESQYVGGASYVRC